MQGMKLVMIMSLSLVLAVSCSYQPSRTIQVRLADVHLWEWRDGEPMWYTLVWYDGTGVYRKTIAKTVRQVDIRIRSGRTCVFAAYPLDSLCPMGGVYEPGDGDALALSFEDGRVADVLLDVVSYNPALVDSLSFHAFEKLIDDDFDEDALYNAFLDGSLGEGRVPRAKTFDVVMDDLPEGRYLAEDDEGPHFDVEHGQSITVRLRAGIHRFYNNSKDLVHVVALYPDGKNSYYDYRLSGW